MWYNSWYALLSAVASRGHHLQPGHMIERKKGATCLARPCLYYTEMMLQDNTVQAKHRPALSTRVWDTYGGAGEILAKMVSGSHQHR